MRTNIVRIGNSQGIRIPKVLIEQCRLGPDVELEVKNKELIIRSASLPRQGWEDRFRRMVQEKDDSLPDAECSYSTWDEEEWQWEDG